MAKARAKLEYLRALPNFENVKVGLELEDDARQGEHVDDLIKRLFAKVEEAVSAKIEEIDAEAKEANVTRKQR